LALGFSDRYGGYLLGEVFIVPQRS
jgi:hypothetical protein